MSLGGLQKRKQCEQQAMAMRPGILIPPLLPGEVVEQGDWYMYLIAEQPAPAPLEGRAALRNVLATVLRVAALLLGEVVQHVQARTTTPPTTAWYPLRRCI